MIKEGKYDARPIDWGYSKIGRNETPAIQVMFEFITEDGAETLNWNGFLTEKAKKRTIETLIMLGFKDKDFNTFCMGKPGRSLDTRTEVSIVVEYEMGNNGKDYPKIKWVNAKNKFAAMMPPQEAKVELDQFRGDLMAAMASAGVTPKQSAMDAIHEDLDF